MKRHLLVLLILIGLILTSCGNSKNVSTVNIDKELIDSVKKIEKLDHKYANFYLTSKEYLSGLDGLFADFFSNEMHYDRSYLPSPIKEDLTNLTEEQLEQVREYQKKGSLTDDITVKISEVYNDNGREWKYVFTKSTLLNEKQSFISYMSKRYVFDKINDKWKIITIDRALNGVELHDGKPRLNIEENMPYNTFNNEKVIYIHEFKPIEYLK